MNKNVEKSTFLERQNDCQPASLIVVKRNNPPKSKEEIEEYLRSCAMKSNVKETLMEDESGDGL